MSESNPTLSELVASLHVPALLVDDEGLVRAASASVSEVTASPSVEGRAAAALLGLGRTDPFRATLEAGEPCTIVSRPRGGGTATTWELAPWPSVGARTVLAIGRPAGARAAATTAPESRVVGVLDGLLAAIGAGRLDARVDPTAVSPADRPIAEALNTLVTSLVEPLDEATDALERLARGELPAVPRASAAPRLTAAIGRWIDVGRRVTEAAERLGRGDLASAIEVRGPDDATMRALDAMALQLSEALQRVRAVTQGIDATSARVSNASRALSTGSTEQASTVEEISAQLGEITAQVKRNSDGAREVSEIMLATREGARASDTQMRDTLSSMRGISEASVGISKIIKVIDEIAFQTNLLALNAAVEAARAGAHGKGFAVVAEEVRNLAARSAAAAKETSQLIEGSLRRVTHGMESAERTATTLGAIVKDVERVSDLVGAIAKHSDEQARGIAVINSGLMHVNEVIQQNAANAEQGAATARELEGQARELGGQLEHFRLREIRVEIPTALDGMPRELVLAVQALLSSGRLEGLVAPRMSRLPPAPPPPRPRPSLLAPRLLPRAADENRTSFRSDFGKY